MGPDLRADQRAGLLKPIVGLNKPDVPEDRYERELEMRLLELARIDRQIRAKP